jgi:hypothetical protein
MRLRIPLLLALSLAAASWSSARGESRVGMTVPLVQVANSGGSNKTPTVFAKMNSSTKRFVNNTKSIFSPKKKSSKGKSATGLVSRQKPPEPGFFYKLFHPEPPPPPRTIDEWMSLKQIHP